MNKSTNIILAVVALLIIVAGWYLFSVPRAVAPVVSNTTATQGSSTAPMTATVKYTANGFTPDSVTIKQGGTVTFTSTDGSPMWVASAMHPTHMVYDGTSRAQHCPNTAGTAFDQCEKSASYSFTFLKVGDWNYHNHVNSGDSGSVTVVQ